jgi:nitroreductase
MSLILPSNSVVAAFEQLVRRRRATPHFNGEEVPAAVIESAFQLAGEAPSGYNIQPWRFVVVRDPEVRARLRAAAFDQEKITEAPVVIVACAEHDAWQDRMEEIFRTRARQNGRAGEDQSKARQQALDFIATLPREVWLNRQVMIGFTYLMLAFEALGWDTAPMEGFDSAAVREVVGLPANAAVVALLAVGRAAGAEPPHPGRLKLADIASGERYGVALNLHQPEPAAAP